MSGAQDGHHVSFDDGDEDDIDLSREVWRLATAEDEADAKQNDGMVAMKDTDVTNTGVPQV